MIKHTHCYWEPCVLHRRNMSQTNSLVWEYKHDVRTCVHHGNLLCKQGSISTTSSLGRWIQIEAGTNVFKNKYILRANWFSVYMTHTLPISGTQNNLISWGGNGIQFHGVYSGCVQGWEKEGSGLSTEGSVYIWTHVKPESKLNWLLEVTTFVAITWNAYQSFLAGESEGPASWWWWARVTGCIV